MPSGIISQNSLAANTWTTIAASPPANTVQQLAISIAALSSITQFFLAISNTGTTTPGNTDFIEFNGAITPNTVYERSGIVLNTGQIVLAKVNESNSTSVNVYGFESSSTTNSGIFQKKDLSANTYTEVLASVSAGKSQAISVNICNRSTTNVAISLAIVTNTAATPTNSQFIEYNTVLGGNGGVLERTGLFLSNTYGLVAWSNSGNVSVVTYGIEGAA